MGLLLSGHHKWDPQSKFIGTSMYQTQKPCLRKGGPTTRARKDSNRFTPASAGSGKLKPPMEILCSHSGRLLRIEAHLGPPFCRDLRALVASFLLPSCYTPAVQSMGAGGGPRCRRSFCRSFSSPNYRRAGDSGELRHGVLP